MDMVAATNTDTDVICHVYDTQIVNFFKGEGEKMMNYTFTVFPLSF